MSENIKVKEDCKENSESENVLTVNNSNPVSGSPTKSLMTWAKGLALECGLVGGEAGDSEKCLQVPDHPEQTLTITLTTFGEHHTVINFLICPSNKVFPVLIKKDGDLKEGVILVKNAAWRCRSEVTGISLLESLPAEMLDRVLVYLGAKDLAALSKVSRNFRCAVQLRQNLWRRLVLREFGDTSVPPHSDYKELYSALNRRRNCRNRYYRNHPHTLSYPH